MKCPVCPEATLSMMERQGFEIDYCPQCRGIWLDRGELDKLIELGVGQQAARQIADTKRPDFVDSDDYGSRNTHGASSSHAYSQRRKKSWLNDIFD